MNGYNGITGKKTSITSGFVMCIYIYIYIYIYIRLKIKPNSVRIRF